LLRAYCSFQGLPIFIYGVSLARWGSRMSWWLVYI
jgi:hypothetical protein